MKISKRVLAGVMSALILATSVPGGQVEAAGRKYENTYLKSITIEKPEVKENTEETDTTSTTDGTATNPDGTTDPNAVTTDGTETTPQEPEVQNETVKVMKGMKFVISSTRYGKLIKLTKNASYFKYKSSDKKIAKVSKKGVVTTLKEGKCDITVTDKKGVEYVIHLVVQKNVRLKSIKLNKTSKKFKKLNKKFGLKATIKVSTKDAGDIPVAWYSTDETVATVDYFGNVKVVGYGVCDICCTAGSNNKIARCKVTVTDPDAKKNEEENNGTNTVRPTYNTGRVVDISRFNTVYDWGKLRDSVDAVIIRVGYRGYGAEGNMVQDSDFASNVYNCQQYGIPYSVYFVTTATNYDEGAAEANFIASRVAGHTLCFPAFMDSEYSNSYHSGRSDNLSAAQRTEAIKGACQGLNSKGIEAGIYASTSFLNNNLNMSELPYSVWVAQYASSCTYGGSKLLWQYTSNGSGYGVRTGGADRCDVSYWYQ